MRNSNNMGRNVNNMSKFQSTAIRHQDEASSIEEAISKFAISCEICVKRGINTDCRTCPIAVYHKQTVNVFIDLQEYDEMKKRRKEEQGLISH